MKGLNEEEGKEVVTSVQNLRLENYFPISTLSLSLSLPFPFSLNVLLH